MAGGFVLPTGDDEMIGFSPVDPVETLVRDGARPAEAGGAERNRNVPYSHGVDHPASRHDERRARGSAGCPGRDDTQSGYVVARVTANSFRPDRRASARAVYDMLKSMMSEMNVELEYQLRNKLRAWVADDRRRAPRTASPAGAAHRPIADTAAAADPTRTPARRRRRTSSEAVDAGRAAACRSMAATRRSLIRSEPYVAEWSTRS